MHANVDDAISSVILTPVVGNIEAAINEAATCENNSLYTAEIS